MTGGFFLLFILLVVVWFVLIMLYSKKVKLQRSALSKFAKKHKFERQDENMYFGKYRDHTVEFSIVKTPVDLSSLDVKKQKKNPLVRTVRTYVKNPLAVTFVASKKIPENSKLLRFLVTGLEARTQEFHVTKYDELKDAEYDFEYDLKIKMDNDFELKNTMTSELVKEFDKYNFFALLCTKGILEARITPYTFSDEKQFEEFLDVFFELVDNIENLS